MPEIEAFRGLVYAPRLRGSLDRLVAPPYDVLSEEQRVRLAERHENNVIHVDLPTDQALIAFRPGDGEFPGRLQFFNPALGIHGSPDRMAERACELRDMGLDGFYAIIAGDKGLDAAAQALPGIRAALR